MYQPKSFQDFARFSIADFHATFNETNEKLFNVFQKQLKATRIGDKRVAFEYLCLEAESN